MSDFRRLSGTFGALIFWLLPQEIIRFPIEIYGFGRAGTALGVFAATALVLTALARVGALSSRWEDLRRRWPVRVVAGLLQLAVTLPTIFYWVWFWAYTRAGVALACTAMLGLAVLGTIRRWWFGPLAALMSFAWIAFAVVMLVRFPPSAASCPGASSRPVTRVALSRDRIDGVPGLRWSNPFDVARDPRDGRLFVTHQSAFWSTRRGGQLTLLRPDGSLVAAALPAEEPCTLYPDRMALDSDHDRLFVLSSGNGIYCLSRFDVKAGLRFEHIERLGGEAHFVVHRDGKLFLLFWPAEGAQLYSDVVLEILDAEDFRSLAKLGLPTVEDGQARRSGRRVGQPVTSPDGRTLWIPTLEGDWVSLDLAAASLPDLTQLHLDEHPGARDFATGGALDAAGTTTFSVSPLTWRLVARDAASGQERGRRLLDGTPEAIAFNPIGGRLEALAFLAGRLDVIDPVSLTTEASVPVGRLARSLTIDPVTGHTWVASGCGVYEVEPMARGAAHE